MGMPILRLEFHFMFQQDIQLIALISTVLTARQRALIWRRCGSSSYKPNGLSKGVSELQVRDYVNQGLIS